jgi:choline dehydrogenase-like flavoprotein
VRPRFISGAGAFFEAPAKAGIPCGDFNGRDRGGAVGVASLVQTNTRKGKRSTTYHGFLEGEAEGRSNLTVITGARASRVLLEGAGEALVATGVEYSVGAGETRSVHAAREVILSAGAVGSPHLLMLSGIGPRRELESADIVCRHELPDVGKHLKDHIQCAMFFPAPGIGVPMTEVGVSLGTNALRAPAGPLPADPADDAGLSGELAALKAEAERRLAEWHATGASLVASSLYDGIAFYSTGLGDPHSHDAQIGFIPSGYNEDLFSARLNIDTTRYFADREAALAAEAESIIVLANPVLPRSEGEIVIESADPATPPRIDFTYFADPYDLKVMVAVMRRALEIVDSWPGPPKRRPAGHPGAALCHHRLSSVVHLPDRQRG